MAFSDVEMSILAQLAYKDIDVDGKGKKLSKVLTDHKDWLQEELGPSYEKYIDNLINKVDGSDYRIVDSEHDKASGFAAYAISTPHNEVVVACRGTQMDQTNDILTDVGLGITPGETQQHRDMEAFVNRLEKKGYDGYYFTGHSLGGNVATHGATTVNDLDKVKGVYAYNAPGFNEAYWILNGWKLKQIKNITNFQNEYDYVSSVLRTPGRTVVIESSLDGNHTGFGDHSINGYTINENGYFQENETGEKHPQTYAGTAVGELGNSFLYHYFPFLRITRILGATKGPVYVYRDFSEASKQKMLGLVTQVESEKWGDFTDWVGDRWYDFESWIGTLNIKNYINNVNTYHKKVIDKNNATEKKINEIFEAVRGVDAAYATTLSNSRASLEQWLRFVDTMAGIVEPGKGRFNGQYMSSALNPILKDVSKANVQQIKDTLVQNVSGEPVFDEELLLEYIKKDPSKMTDEEKQAVLEAIADLEDTVAFYETAWSVGNDNMSAAFLNRAAWVSDTNKFASFSAISAHYNEMYVKVLEACLEQGAESNTFAASLLKICNGEDALTVLGLDCSADVSKIFGTASLAEYVAQWKTEHTDEHYARCEFSEKNSSFVEELKKNYGVDDLLAGSGYIGKIHGFIDDIKSAEGWYDYVDTGANIFSFLTNAKKTWNNYKLIGNAVGVKTSTTWWFKNVTGIKPLGRASTASTWIKRFGNNLTNKTSPFAAQLKDVGKNFTGGNGVGKAVSSWASVAVTGVVNFFGNKQEQEESNGTMSDGRVVAETITETAIDTAITLGASAVVGAAVAACTTVALPGVVVTAAAGLVIAGANAGIKALTGKSGTEWASDLILDTGEKVVSAVGNAAKNVKNAVGGWFKKLKFA